MTRTGGLTCRVALAIVTAACSGRSDQAEQTGAETGPAAQSHGQASLLVLDSAQVERMGIVARPLAVSRQNPTRDLAAEVVPDPTAVTTIRAGLTGLLSLPAGAEWPTLGRTVEADQVLGQIADAVPFRAPRSGTVSRVSAFPGEIVQGGQDLIELTQFGRPLVRVSRFDSGERPPATLRLADDQGHEVSATLIGSAPEADPTTGRTAWLYRGARDPGGWRPGLLISARVPEPAPRGSVLIPTEAVVQWKGLAWVFVARGTGQFERVRVPTDLPVKGGWLTRDPFQAGEPVVVSGAEQLLSEEFRSRIVVGEEVGE